ncbi:T9SS type B sorting domain-containing protein [Hymenobacter rubidus]|uniref:T9SS type B sorting domain-containing protein n=1 Tax=Hymenobacter rubidus TaxID=1441626 RepID=UPI00191CC732|nr:gliding motility-associated C-terminal domain-containing protein [Hymenobacter rubidus]
MACLLTVLAAWAMRPILAQTVYVPAAVTGYTADVIANGAGTVASSTTNTVDRGNATVKWCFANHTFTNPAGISLLNQPALPDNGLITSISTPGLTFQMAAANVNNSLRIDGAASGTLTLVTPQPCSEVMVLATEGNGSTAPKTFTVTFTDGTTQVFTNIVVPDWFNGTITPAILVGSRVGYVDNSVDVQTTNPRLYEVRLTLNVANYSKLVQSVNVSKTSTDPVLNVMGISLGSNCLGVPTPGTANAAPTTVCSGSPTLLTLTGNTVSGGITFQWQSSTNGGTTWTDIAGATANFYSARPTVTTQYRARVTCSLQSAISTPVTVTVPPSVATVAYNSTPGTPASFCLGGTAPVVTATPAGGRFTSSNAGLVLDATTGTLNLGASTAGTYTVTYTVTTPCPATGTTTVTVNQTIAAVAYSAASFCRNSTTTVVPAVTPAGGTFTATTGLSINATTGAINLPNSLPGTYTVTYVSGGTCPGTATTTVTVSETIATLAYSASSYCRTGQTTSPTPTVTPAGGAFTSTAGLSLNATTGAINLTVSQPGTYTVTYVSGGACPGVATANVTVTETVPRLAYSGVSTPPTFCASGTASVVTATPAGGTFSSTTGLAINATTGVVNLASSTPGTYTVTYTVATPCPASTTATFTISPPVAAFSYACPPFYQNGPAAVPNVPAGGGTFSAPAGLTINPTTGVVDLTNSTMGNYTISYTTANGCVGTAPFQVVDRLIFPNVITPNGDGKNDALKPNLPNVTGYHMQIYSRWGIKVFDGRDPAQAWSAADNSGGMYYYQLDYTDCTGKAQSLKSWVDVIK